MKAALIVDFDFGVPSLASIVEPVAERVLTDVTKQIMRGLFGTDVVFADEVESQATPLDTEEEKAGCAMAYQGSIQTTGVTVAAT